MRLFSRVILLFAILYIANATILNEGFYSLSESAPFNNILINSSIIAERGGYFDVSVGGLTLTAQLNLLDTNSDQTTLFTIQMNVGYDNGKLVLSYAPQGCIQNNGNSGFSVNLCTVLNSQRGCSGSFNWAQATDTSNLQFILIEGFCGLAGTQAFICHDAISCNAIPAQFAFPNGTFSLYSTPPVLQDPLVSDFNNLIVQQITATINGNGNYFPMTYISIYTAVNPAIKLQTQFNVRVGIQDTGAYLFAIDNCLTKALNNSAAFFDPCTAFMYSPLGCATSVYTNQFDANPPNNLTVIQIPGFCNAAGNIQLRCITSNIACGAPITTKDGNIIVDAGNCLQFNGNILNFVGGCSVTNNVTFQGVTVNQLSVQQLTVQNETVFQQLSVQQLTVQNQTVLQQTIINATIVNQTVQYAVIKEEVVLTEIIVSEFADNITVYDFVNYGSGSYPNYQPANATGVLNHLPGSQDNYCPNGVVSDSAYPIVDIVRACGGSASLERDNANPTIHEPGVWYAAGFYVPLNAETPAPGVPAYGFYDNNWLPSARIISAFFNITGHFTWINYLTNTAVNPNSCGATLNSRGNEPMGYYANRIGNTVTFYLYYFNPTTPGSVLLGPTTGSQCNAWAAIDTPVPSILRPAYNGVVGSTSAVAIGTPVLNYLGDQNHACTIPLVPWVDSLGNLLYMPVYPPLTNSPNCATTGNGQYFASGIQASINPYYISPAYTSLGPFHTFSYFLPNPV